MHLTLSCFDFLPFDLFFDFLRFWVLLFCIFDFLLIWLFFFLTFCLSTFSGFDFLPFDSYLFDFLSFDFMAFDLLSFDFLSRNRAYRCHTKHRSRSGHEGHFLLRGHTTRVLWVVFHAESDGHPYVTKSANKKGLFSNFYFWNKTTFLDELCPRNLMLPFIFTCDVQK